MDPKTNTQPNSEDSEGSQVPKFEPKQKPPPRGLTAEKAVAPKQRTQAQIEASRRNGIKGGKTAKQTEAEKAESLRSRLFSRYVINDSGCWLWQGITTHRGYGVLRNCYRLISAHKASFLLHGGVLTKERPFVLHSCHNRNCINPQHLRAGTAKENSQDMVSAGRQARGENSGTAKLDDATVIAIRKAYAARKNFTRVAAEFGTTRKNISAIVKRKTWKHILE